jgi:hypothetical protein
MEILNQSEGIELITNFLIRNTVVPIIGSGFTAGSKSCSGYVLNGNQLEEKMREIILHKSKTYSQDDILTLSFNDLSEIFFDKSEISIEDRHNFFRSHFTEVVLPKHKIEFLKIWRYIYTINFDDAIERNTEYETILSYASLRNELINIIKKKNYVLKLHGDVNREIMYENENNIILSGPQYITSLMDKSNAQLVKSIHSDYKQKNILFIGCSLKNEPDLKQLYKNVQNDLSSNYIMYLCRSEGNAADKKRLEKYGVNTLIMIDDYDSFYTSLVEVLDRKNSLQNASEYRFKNPKITMLKSKEAILENISFGKSPFDIKRGLFRIPSSTTERTILNEVIRCIEDGNRFISIKGRRFSGKTTLLQLIIERIPRLEKIFFPSEYWADSNTVKNLINQSTDTALIFDSNSITSEIYNVILSGIDAISDNNNVVIIASNTNEDFLISQLKAQSFVLNQYFNSDEIYIFNEHANRLAFIRRNQNQTNLEYSYNLLKQNNMDMRVIPQNISALSNNQRTIMFMLCVFDRMYLHEAIHLDITQKDIDGFISQYPILFEKIDCDLEESNGKSVEKVVHNSKSVILNLVKNMRREDVIISISSIVNNLYKYDRQQYKAAIMFDTLNQLFSADGAGSLIEYIYQELERDLYNEHHFWIQRAKSIYRLFRNDKDKLLQAISYVLKVANDTESLKNPNLYIKSTFIASLIYCILYNIEKDQNDKINYQIKSIEFARVSILTNHYQYIPSSVKNDIFSERNLGFSVYENIMIMCENFITHPENNTSLPIIVDYAISIKERLRYMKESYERRSTY